MPFQVTLIARESVLSRTMRQEWNQSAISQSKGRQKTNALEPVFSAIIAICSHQLYMESVHSLRGIPTFVLEYFHMF